MRVAVIGGTGRMGRWFARYFIANKHDVGIFGRDSKKTTRIAEEIGAKSFTSLEACSKNSNVLIIAVPIYAITKHIEQIAPKLKKDVTLIEITSIKEGVITVLRKIKNVNIISIHPLFGPGASIKAVNRYAMVPVLNPIREGLAFKRLFPKSEVIVVEAEEHDMAMAKVLSLTHLMNALFLKTVGGNTDDLSKLSGTTFGIQLALAMGVMHDEPNQLASLQVQNKHFKEVLRDMIKTTKEWQNLIEAGEQEALSVEYSKIKNAIEKQKAFRESYDKMYAMFRSLQKGEY
ncbi:MAG: prephenate dehydrogenase/arogenate dehydrogenase family protein [Thaumarchaeota archaeon]|nr:prephenate dehydrogenase/arogenate dehydrogenase family protein [Nitrososphaerota archaeon]